MHAQSELTHPLFVNQFISRYSENAIREALAKLEEQFGGDSIEIATELNRLAQILYANGKRSEAAILRRRVLKIVDHTYK